MMPDRPRKYFGQHFLHDRNIIDKIIAAIAPQPDEHFVEIGPGRGALTGPLLDHAAQVDVIEIDRALAADLETAIPDPRLTVHLADALKFDFAQIKLSGDRLRLAGNLPYNISKPIVMKLVREREQVDRAVLMFQREVALRLSAVPGERDYGPLGILAGQAYEIDRLFDLGPDCFRPRPRVMSTVTLWRARSDAVLTAAEEQTLRSCLAACFARRRQTLRDFASNAQGLRDRQFRPALQTVVERLPFQIFDRLEGHAVVFIDLVDRDNVIVLEPGRGAGLAQKTFLGIGFLGHAPLHHLERDRAL